MLLNLAHSKNLENTHISHFFLGKFFREKEHNKDTYFSLSREFAELCKDGNTHIVEEESQAFFARLNAV